MRAGSQTKPISQVITTTSKFDFEVLQINIFSFVKYIDFFLSKKFITSKLRISLTLERFAVDV